MPLTSKGFPLFLTFDLDAETMWTARDPAYASRPILMSQGAYGWKVGAGRILDLLDRYGLKATFSSGAGLSPLKHRTAYCASKVGLQMASKALAMGAAEFGIRVNTVRPGAVETELFRSSIDSEPDPAATYEVARARYALRRIAAPAEIAAAILWLRSAESSYVTGTAIAVDGGRTFH